MRWVEWSALAFLMTFLTGNIDLPLKDESSPRFLNPILLSLSTVCGMIFAFCQTLAQWLFVCTISWVLFFAIYVMLYQRATRFWKARTEGAEMCKTAAHEGRYQLMRSSYLLCVCCSLTWTLLAVVFCIICLGPTYSAPDSWLAHPALPVLGHFVL